MQEIKVELNLDDLPDAKKMTAAFRELREKYLMEAEIRGKRLVDEAINTSGLRDTHGKVKRWQKPDRKTGYVAVRAETTSKGKDSPGAITNYLESGHASRTPSGKARYRPRVHTGRARAFRFYQKADVQAKALADELEKRFCQELDKRLEEGK